MEPPAGRRQKRNSVGKKKYFFFYLYIYIYKIIHFNFFFFVSKKKKFRTVANNFASCEFFFATPSIFVVQFCFDHNFFIRTLFWIILVSLEILESVESKYS